MSNRDGSVGAILVAAGRGTRMGGVDKCALPLLGRTMASYSVEALAPIVDALVVVVAPDRVTAWEKIAARERWPRIVVFVGGGETRQESARAGVDALMRDGMPDVIAIHDGARPLVTSALARACIDRAMADGAAIAAVPVTDTIKRVEGGMIVETPNRTTLWAAQTPQAFRAVLLRDAFVWAAQHAPDAFTDEAGLVAASGHTVSVVPGDRTNIKVTEPADRLIAETLLAARTGMPRG